MPIVKSATYWGKFEEGFNISACVCIHLHGIGFGEDFNISACICKHLYGACHILEYMEPRHHNLEHKTSIVSNCQEDENAVNDAPSIESLHIIKRNNGLSTSLSSPGIEIQDVPKIGEEGTTIGLSTNDQPYNQVRSTKFLKPTKENEMR